MKGVPLPASSLLFILALMFSACAPAAAPTPVPALPSTPVAAAPPPAPRVVTAPTPAPRFSTPTPVVAPAKPAPAATSGDKPRYGGVLQMVSDVDAPHYDMVQQTTRGIILPTGTFYNNLLEIDRVDPDLVVPGLAERWETSPDGKLYTFYLRQGVKWHDGKPFTSADVKASLERMMWPPKGQVSFGEGFFTAVSKVEAPDANTVRLVLNRPQSSLPLLLTIPQGFIYPKHILDAKKDMKKDILGTGPFRYKSFMRGVSWEMERNPDYWRPGQPYLDGLTLFIVTDQSARIATLRTRRAQLISTGILILSAEQEGILVKEGLKLLKSPGGPTFLFMNIQRKPWDDVRVRRAISLATDRQASVQVVFEGIGQVGGYMAPGPWALPAEELLKLPGYRQPKDQDIAEAKRLLAEAGYASGFSTTLLTRSDPQYYVKANVFMADLLRRLGINAQVKVVEPGAIKEFMARRDFDAMAYKMTPPLFEPDTVYSYYYTTAASSNFGQYGNPRIDDLFAKQSASTDPAERKRLVLEMERLLIEDVPSVVLNWYEGSAWFWADEVRGYGGAKAPDDKAAYRFDTVWLAK